MAKKKKYRKVHYDKDTKLQYMSIGHAGGPVVIWAHIGGEIETWNEDAGDHKAVLKESRFKYWRGRYEEWTNRCSVICPNSENYCPVPSWLKDKLEAEFGSSIEFYAFNPKRSK